MPLTHFDPGPLIDQVEAALEINLVSAAAELSVRMKQLAPARTGALRDSITSESDGLTAVAGSPLGYALDVEFGTAAEAAEPFMLPALDNAAGEIAAIILTP